MNITPRPNTEGQHTARKLTQHRRAAQPCTETEFHSGTKQTETYEQTAMQRHGTGHTMPKNNTVRKNYVRLLAASGGKFW
jgi:hypothetical protein